MSNRKSKLISLITFVIGFNQAFLFFCTAYLAFNDHLLEAVLYSVAVVSTIVITPIEKLKVMRAASQEK